MLTKTSVFAFLAIAAAGIVMNVAALSYLDPAQVFNLPL
jgi:hypothetical protein